MLLEDMKCSKILYIGTLKFSGIPFKVWYPRDTANLEPCECPQIAPIGSLKKWGGQSPQTT